MMSKLTDFYAHRALIQNASADSRLEKLEWEQLEDELIREEILPEILNQVTTVLDKVKSPLDIHIISNPEGLYSITASRCIARSIGYNPSKNPEIEPESESDPIVPETKFTRNKSVGFSVAFPDGTIFHDKKASQTFMMSLKKIGLSRIASGKHGVVHNGVNVVSRVGLPDNDGPARQTEFEGFFVYTHLSNKDKIEDIETLGKYYNLGLEVRWDDEPQSPKPISKKKKGTRDTTKYSLNRGEALPKRRLALAIVKQYCQDHPETNIDDLQKVFPGELISGRYGVVRSMDDMPNISDEEKHKRYFMEDEDAIFLNNDDIIVVCNQWGDNIKGMIEIAKGLGYAIDVVG